MTVPGAREARGARRLLVTGGSGFLGRHLVTRAVDAGWQVVATVHRHRPDGLDPRASWAVLDLRDPDSVTAMVADARPDAVINTAYVQAGPDLDAITHRGAACVAAAAGATGAALVQLSTDVVFDGRRLAPGRYTEADPVAPRHDYGRAKAAAESAVARAHPDPLVVRTSLLYAGPGRAPGAHEQVVLDTLTGRADWRFHTDEWRCPVVVDDLAAALVELIGRESAGAPGGLRCSGGARVIHLAGPEGVTRSRFAQLVAVAHGFDPAAVPTAPLRDASRPANVMLDSSLAASTLRTALRGVTEVFTSEGAGRVFPASRDPE